MADYTGDAEDVYKDIAEDGGPIIFTRLVSVDPSDVSLPWEGGEQVTEQVEHVALFAPLKDTALSLTDPFKEGCYIPAFGLDFEIEIGQVITKADGTNVTVTDVIPLKLDGLTTILYTCGVSEWQGT